MENFLYFIIWYSNNKAKYLFPSTSCQYIILSISIMFHTPWNILQGWWIGWLMLIIPLFLFQWGIYTSCGSGPWARPNSRKKCVDLGLWVSFLFLSVSGLWVSFHFLSVSGLCSPFFRGLITHKPCFDSPLSGVELTAQTYKSHCPFMIIFLCISIKIIYPC